jgi:two-component system chemotaxis response regulator CheB
MIRVVIAEDSPVVAEIVRAVLEQDPEFRVVGVARHGAEAVALTRTLRPDLVTMDIHMPVLDGIEATRAIMEEAPTPILVISSAVHEESTLAFRAIQAGAVDVIEKPLAPLQDQYARLDLVRRARMVSGITPIRRLRRRTGAVEEPVQLRTGHVLGIAASTGGPAALLAVLSALPREFPCPILVVQHIAHGFLHGLVDWLGGQVGMPVRVAERGEVVKPGAVVFAPEEHHMLLAPDRRIVLTRDPPIDGHRPSATALFESIAESCGRSAVGVVLTGMGRDGARGLLKLRESGGRALCQDEASSLIYGMPRAAIENGAAERAVGLDSMATEIVSTLRR